MFFLAYTVSNNEIKFKNELLKLLCSFNINHTSLKTSNSKHLYIGKCKKGQTSLRDFMLTQPIWDPSFNIINR